MDQRGGGKAMRIGGMIATFTTLIAAAVAVFGLTRLGFSLWEIVKLTWPVALAVAVLSVLLLKGGQMSARWLNRTSSDDQKEDNSQAKRSPS